jgi:hypothetical protein
LLVGDAHPTLYLTIIPSYMEIIEQTSERLTIQDSSLNLGMSKLLFSIFSIWGGGDVIYAVINPSFLNAIIVIHIVFLLSMSTALAIFPQRHTVCFDKTLSVLAIEKQSIASKRVSLYSLAEIIAVIVCEKTASDSDEKYYILTLLSTSQPQGIQLLKGTLQSLQQAEEIADLIHSFLDLEPLAT